MSHESLHISYQEWMPCLFSGRYISIWETNYALLRNFKVLRQEYEINSKHRPCTITGRINIQAFPSWEFQILVEVRQTFVGLIWAQHKSMPAKVREESLQSRGTKYLHRKVFGIILKKWKPHDILCCKFTMQALVSHFYTSGSSHMVKDGC